MAQIHNTDLFKELTDGGKIQTAFDRIPNQLADKVVPVMEVNPKLLRRVNIIIGNTCANATQTVVYTTPTNTDFFLCGVAITVCKDAGSTSTNTFVGLTPKGKAAVTACFGIGGVSGQVQSESLALDLADHPIPLERNTQVTLNNATNAANIKSTITIYGYIVENVNA